MCVIEIAFEMSGKEGPMHSSSAVRFYAPLTRPDGDYWAQYVLPV
ncbi:MAG: hypothetical protein NTV54_04420 [Ignavibacteriales bacterium]|nr:hypothetical protein [Ignavibacteriales bacterium]